MQVLAIVCVGGADNGDFDLTDLPIPRSSDDDERRLDDPQSTRGRPSSEVFLTQWKRTGLIT